MEDDGIRAAIERVLAGDASAEDEQRVRRWVQASPANEAELRILEAAWNAAARAGRHYDSRRAWSSVRARMALSEAAQSDDAPTPRTEPRRSALRSNVMRWAAVFALLIGGGVLLGRMLPTSRGDVMLIARQVSTGPGDRTTVRLGDGSLVVLGPGSTLREVEGADDDRRVALTGSAYFDVAHDEQRPFVVVAGAVETRVLGTTFAVRGYGDGSPVEVVVESGRVRVRPDVAGEGVVLVPGQMGTVTSDGSVTVRSGVDVDARLGWREGRLYFEATPLRDVAAEIERWYGIEITIADSSIATYPLTATFADASVTDVLTIVSRSLGIRHSFDGDSAAFRP